MAEKVSIAERIERELLRRMDLALPAFVVAEVAAERMNATDQSAAAAVRWDADEDGEAAVGLFSPLLSADEEEDSEAGGQGGGGQTNNTQRYVWLVHWQKRKQVEKATATHRRWAAFFERVAVVDDQLKEGGDGAGSGGAALLVEVEKVGAQLLEPVQDVPNFTTAFFFEVSYDTNRGDPYVGPGIGLLEE